MSIGPLLVQPGDGNDWQNVFVTRVVESFTRVTRRDLVAELALDPAALGKSAWMGDFALLTHRGDEKATLNYGNRFALALWQCDWPTFISTPSAATAPAQGKEEREAMMQRVARDGYVAGYCGRRVSTRGRLFMIENVTIWRLLDPDGQSFGVGAVFRQTA